MRDIPLRILIERLEDLITAQQKLASLILFVEDQKVELSVPTTIDMLYAHMEMLELVSEVISSFQDISDSYIREYAVMLTAEALSWIGFMLPYLEASSPIFIEHLSVVPKIKSIVSFIERFGSEVDFLSSEEILKTIDAISKTIMYQLFVAKRSYEAMS
ncbi:hypothetical protein [Hydrogenobacter hydrogenophilus]|uniref:Uncharacterized protein n=1 Tax=Hydrogenobacter hydrogenophilus TaxID=35835 RepID=A0A285NUC1_9AQUI|nr:hypothetical protein [Hydrogenobacter hydrogenophilus]SNZ13082.1 hypothetical protein SAMN06265353_0612 [Hydrogenobacter hydrogenophilus]